MPAEKYTLDRDKRYDRTWVYLYHLAVDSGYFTGTMNEWLDSLHQGIPGKSAYDIAVDHGYNGTEDQWIAMINNTNDRHFEFPLVLGSNWTVPHGLGKYPSVTLVDNSGIEYECSVRHIDNNTCELSTSAQFSGVAILN